MTQSDIDGLSFALNEATVCGVEFDEERRIFATTLVVLWLPEDGPEPKDLRLQFCFFPVGRLAVSLRGGFWNDEKAPTIPLVLADVDRLIDNFGGNIYGHSFFDVHEEELAFWHGRMSLNWSSKQQDGHTHSFRLFQEASVQHLDLLVWFDELRIFRSDFEEVSVPGVVDGSRRWWTAWQRDDPRTKGHGIIRLSDAGDG